MKQLTESMMIQRLGGALGACLLASALLLSCSKTPGQESRGKEIRFGAVTAADPQTKTAYTGVEVGGKERIDWKIGDYVRVYSDKAVCVMNSSQHWADYRLATPMIDPDNHAQSWAEIVPVALTGITYHGGLQWADDSAHDFYGFYPSPKTDDGAEFDSSAKVLSGMEIATSQTVTPATVKDIDTGTDISVYYPDMQKAYMTAFLHTLSPTESLHEDLVFNPAYTAFHIGFKAQVASKVESVEIKSTSSNLTGTYTATHNGSAWVYARTGDAASSTATKVSTQTLDIDLAAGAGLEVELFTLPLDATNLSLYINVKEAGISKTYILDLKAASAITDFQGNNYAAGAWLNFKACRKVYLRGLLLPGAPWTIDGTTTINVISSTIAPWDEKPDDITYGSGPVINASGLTEVNLSAHKYSFSIYAPVGETWQIKVLNDSKVVVTGVTISQDGTSNSGAGELTGIIGSPAKVDFTLSGSTGGNNCTLSFSVIMDKGGPNEREYSINSEVVQGTWVDDPLDTKNYQFINFTD